MPIRARQGAITFTLDPGLASGLGGYTAADFKADIAAKQAAGKKVILSVGGQNGTISVSERHGRHQLRQQRPVRTA